MTQSLFEKYDAAEQRLCKRLHQDLCRGIPLPYFKDKGLWTPEMEKAYPLLQAARRGVARTQRSYCNSYFN